ncbi:hypothetical protein [Aestuariivivens marinum]|uniref:hypothetical protein n=1 Tax=Aestuariivivens marinum TaxID=2913555 RepID=UPI001F57FE65|nr:hypothetical protein [Aestuariivivens marinum]
MKKFKYILLIVTFSIAANFVSAQRIGNLDGINYQAVALNDETQEIVGLDIEAKPLYNREIGVRFTITKGLEGAVQWEETHVTTTDAYGLFSLVIGKGVVSSSTYSRLLDIPWIEADQFLKVEISTKNDGNFKIVSNQKFMAVPYSFYTDDIADDAITTEKILNEEILAEDIAEGAVETSEILNETILAEDISEGAVETSEILNETILAEDISEGAVETSEILNETILAEDISEGAVETSEILNETILAEDISEGAVETSEILNETILAEDISEGAVETSEILNETILAEDISTGAVETSEILNETILAEDISEGAVETSEILNETILNEDIANNTINLSTKVTDILAVENGGTGLDASAVGDGEILIGDGTTNEFNLTTLTAGTGIVIENTPGNITIISPPVSTSADGSFNIPVGSNGVIGPNSAWYSPNSLKIDPPADKAFEMGDIFLASADIDLQGCILSVYLQSIDGNGQANVQVILFNPRNIPVTLQTPVTFKFLLVK